MIDSPETLQLCDEEKRLLDKTPDTHREAQLLQLMEELNAFPEISEADQNKEHPLRGAQIALKIAGILLDLDRKDEAWDYARPTIEPFVANDAYEDAALACQYVYLSDQNDAIAAIGQAAWLSVTYPVNPHLTANVLNHIIDETPDDSDGGAVAAAAAHFVVDQRCDTAQREELRLFTGANLARVAKRHSNVQSQIEFELWVERLELDVPDKLLMRLRNVIDVLVQTDWWFDRDELQSKLPD
jgi:hypothetical protein